MEMSNLVEIGFESSWNLGVIKFNKSKAIVNGLITRNYMLSSDIWQVLQTQKITT